jgi:hypothetical protein
MSNIPTQGIVVAAVLVAMIGIVSTTTTAAFADRERGESTADDQIHNNPGAGFLGSDQDIRFHEGICQGGSSGDACDLPFIGEPGGREALDGR